MIEWIVDVTDEEKVPMLQERGSEKVVRRQANVVSLDHILEVGSISRK